MALATRGIALASFTAPPFLNDKNLGPFKKVKACLTQHRSDKIAGAGATDFLAIHKVAIMEVLVSALEAYEKHRDELVDKSKGKSVSTVEYLKGKVRRRMEARIDWGDWSAMAVAVVTEKLPARPDGSVDYTSGAWTVVCSLPAVLQRLLHPYNTQAVRLTGFELLLLLMCRTPTFDLSAPLVLQAFQRSLREDHADPNTVDGKRSASEEPGLPPSFPPGGSRGSGGVSGSVAVSEPQGLRPEVLSVEYAEFSSAQGLAAAKAGGSAGGGAGGGGDASGEGAPGESSEAGERGGDQGTASGGSGFLSVRLLRAAYLFSVSGPRELFVGGSAVEAGDPLPLSSADPPGSASQTALNAIDGGGGGGGGGGGWAGFDAANSTAAQTAAFVFLLKQLLPLLNAYPADNGIVISGANVGDTNSSFSSSSSVSGGGAAGLAAAPKKKHVSPRVLKAFADLLRETVDQVMAKPLLADLLLGDPSNDGPLFSSLLHLVAFPSMLPHYTRLLTQEGPGVPSLSLSRAQGTARFGECCLRWASQATDAFATEAHCPGSLTQGTLLGSCRFLLLLVEKLLESVDECEATVTGQHPNRGAALDRQKQQQQQLTTSVAVSADCQALTGLKSRGGLPAAVVSEEARFRLKGQWSSLVEEFLTAAHGSFAHTKSETFVLAMKDMLQVVLVSAERSVERGLWRVFGNVRTTLVRWCSERYTCKVNSIGANVIEQWKLLLVERSGALIKHLTFNLPALGRATGLSSVNTAAAATATANALLTPPLPLQPQARRSLSPPRLRPPPPPPPPSRLNSGVPLQPLRKVGSGSAAAAAAAASAAASAAAVSAFPGGDLVWLLQLLPSVDLELEVTDAALQLAVVDAVDAFVRTWLDGAVGGCQEVLTEPCPAFHFDAGTEGTGTGGTSPQAFAMARATRQGRERPLVSCPASVVAAATVLGLACPFLLPVLESNRNRPAATQTAKLLSDALVLRHDKALFFPPGLEARMCVLLLKSLRVATGDPNHSPAHSWERSGRRCVDVLTGCLQVAAFDAPQCAALINPTLKLAAKWFDGAGRDDNEHCSGGGGVGGESATMETSSALVETSASGAEKGGGVGTLPKRISDRPDELCKVVRGFLGLAGRVTTLDRLALGSDHEPGASVNEDDAVPLFETLLTFLLSTVESAGGGGGNSGGNSSTTSAHRVKELAEQRAQLLGDCAVALTLLHCQKLSAVKKTLLAAAPHSQTLPTPTSSSPLTPATPTPPPSPKAAAGAHSSSLAAALEELEAPTAAVLSCLLDLCANEAAPCAASLPFQLVGVRCLRDLARAYPEMFQELQVRDVVGRLVAVGRFHLAAILHFNNASSSTSSTQPASRRRSVTVAGSSGGEGSSWHEKVTCAVLDCLVFWLCGTPQQRTLHELSDDDPASSSAFAFLAECLAAASSSSTTSKNRHNSNSAPSSSSKPLPTLLMNKQRNQTHHQQHQGERTSQVAMLLAVRSSAQAAVRRLVQGYRVTSFDFAAAFAGPVLPPGPFGGAGGGTGVASQSKGNSFSSAATFVSSGPSVEDASLVQTTALGGGAGDQVEGEWVGSGVHLSVHRGVAGGSTWVSCEHDDLQDSDGVDDSEGGGGMQPPPLLWLGNTLATPVNTASGSGSSASVRDDAGGAMEGNGDSGGGSNGSAKDTDKSKAKVFGLFSSSSFKSAASPPAPGDASAPSPSSVPSTAPPALPPALPPLSSPPVLLPAPPFSAESGDDLFDDLLDVFTDLVDTKDDPSFLGNSWGVAMFGNDAIDAEVANALAALQLQEEVEEEEEEQKRQADQQMQRSEETTTSAVASATEAVDDENAAGGAGSSPPAKVPSLNPLPSISPSLVKSTSSSSSSSVAPMLDSMKWLLKDQGVLDQFLVSLEREHAAESLHFYFATREFDAVVLEQGKRNQQRRLSTYSSSSPPSSPSSLSAHEEEGDSNTEVLAAAVAIFNEYIKPGSDRQINVPAVMVKNIRASLGIEDPVAVKRAAAAKVRAEKALKERQAAEAAAQAAAVDGAVIGAADSTPRPEPSPTAQSVAPLETGQQPAVAAPPSLPPPPPPPPPVAASPTPPAPAAVLKVDHDKLPDVFAAAVREVTMMLLKDKVPNFAGDDEKAPRRVKLVGEVEATHHSLAAWAKHCALAARTADPFSADPLAGACCPWDPPTIASAATEEAAAAHATMLSPYAPPLRCMAKPPLPNTMLANCGRFPAPPTPPLAVPHALLSAKQQQQQPTAEGGVSFSGGESGSSSSSSSGGGARDVRTSAHLVMPAATRKELRELDRLPAKHQVNVGVVFVLPLQTTQAEILSNSVAFPEFEAMVRGMAAPQTPPPPHRPSSSSSATTVSSQVALPLPTTSSLMSAAPAPPSSSSSLSSLSSLGFSSFCGGLTLADLAEGVEAVPVFVDSTTELALHVSTHMRCDDGEKRTKTKMKHLGNDWVHVAWSESDRDFLPSAFSAQANFVCLVVYPHRRSSGDSAAPTAPLTNSASLQTSGSAVAAAQTAPSSLSSQRLYRIQVLAKEPLGGLVTTTGPLADGCVVGGDALPLLLRLTCLNICAALRQERKVDMEHLERRAASLARATAAANVR